MANSVERQERIGKIRAFPSVAEATVAGLTDAQLDTPYRNGGWTVRQVVHHLADSHLNGYGRMKLILTEERPTIKTYEQDDWAKLRDASELPIESSLAILRGLHERWTYLLEGLSESDWSRVAVHPDCGEITLDKMLETYAAHGETHLKPVAELRRARGW